MPDRMPILLNPEHAATEGLKTSGLLKLGTMERLLNRLAPPFGEVNVTLQFGLRGQQMYMQGRMTGEIFVQCQRCLQVFAKPINHEFSLGLIYSEAEICCLLPGEEPLLISNEPLQLADVIEDELELLLPMVAKHPIGQCNVTSGMEFAKVTEQKNVSNASMQSNQKNDPGDSEQIKREAKPNPFAELVKLKKH